MLCILWTDTPKSVNGLSLISHTFLKLAVLRTDAEYTWVWAASPETYIMSLRKKCCGND